MCWEQYYVLYVPILIILQTTLDGSNYYPPFTEKTNKAQGSSA